MLCLTLHNPKDRSTPGLPVVVKVIKGELFLKKLITFTITRYFTISSVLLSFLKVDISIDIICIPPEEIVLTFIVVHSGLLVIKFFSFLLSGNIILHSFLKDIFLLDSGLIVYLLF